MLALEGEELLLEETGATAEDGVSSPSADSADKIPAAADVDGGAAPAAAARAALWATAAETRLGVG